MHNYQFFTHANDSGLKRKLLDNLNLGPTGIKREALVDNLENGFDRLECTGYTLGGGSDSSQPERWYLLMREPISFEIGGKARQVEGLIGQAGENAIKVVNISKVGVQ